MGEFTHWLTESRQQPGTAAARASNCATVERAYGIKLNALNKEHLSQLIEEFAYSTADQRAGRAVKHRVLIKGDQYNGTATLRSALKLYFDFRFQLDTAGRPTRPGPSPVPSPTRSGNWPEWEFPSEDDSLLLAKLLARHARFLNPERTTNKNRVSVRGSSRGPANDAEETSAVLISPPRSCLSDPHTGTRWSPRSRGTLRQQEFRAIEAHRTA